MSAARYYWIKDADDARRLLTLPKNADTYELRVKAARFLELEHQRELARQKDGAQ